ncbi:histone-lysine N-methyltransferase SETMAR [Trichonephila clavipes]|nr:histone-lysine N-methyltransferase SETMAR [Trichonephila clavipes]
MFWLFKTTRENLPAIRQAIWAIIFDKMFTEFIEVDRYVSSRSIAQELNIDHKTVLSHLRIAEFKKKLHVWVTHQLPPKNMTDRISICEALAKWNEINPFLKWMETGDKEWVPYYNIVQKRS